MNASTLPTPGRTPFDELLLQQNLRLRVGEHVVDVGALRIVTHPQRLRLTSKAAGVLLELVRHAGDTVTRDQLLERVWADRVTTPDVLTQAIKELRRGFGDDAKPSRYIETIPKVGYRLLAPVRLLDAEPLASARATPAGNDPEIAATPPRAAASAAGAPAAEAAAAPPRRARRVLLIMAALAAVAVAIAFIAHSQHADRAAGWTATGMRTITSDPGSERRPAVSPDGTRVAYAQLDSASGVDRLVVRALGQSQAMRITAGSTAFEEVPAWSPDGTQIAFERLAGDGCTVYIVPSLGGPEREVGACRDHNTHYFDWTPDGQALITAEQSSGSAASMVLTRWDLATGAKQPLRYAHGAGDQDLEAHYSPDGRWLAFRRGLAPYSDLWVMDAAGGKPRQLTQLHARIRGYAWTSDSGGLVFSSNHAGAFALYSVALRDGALRPLGVGPGEYPGAARNADAVAYEIPRTTNRLAWVRLGVDKALPELLAKSTGSDASPALSPDGNRIAFISDRSGTQQLWLYDFSANAATALTDYRAALLLAPAWSADGKRLLVTVRGKDKPGLVEIDLATRRQRTIGGAGDDVLSGNYAADADSFLIVSGARAAPNRLVLLEHAGGAAEKRTVLASGIEHFEPDPTQRRVYYTKNAQRGLFVRPLDGGPESALTTRVDSTLMDGWRIVDGRVWFVAKVAWKPTDLIELDPDSGGERVLGHFETELHDVAFSATPARDRIVIVPLGVEDTDIGAFRLDRL